MTNSVQIVEEDGKIKKFKLEWTKVLKESTKIREAENSWHRNKSSTISFLSWALNERFIFQTIPIISSEKQITRLCSTHKICRTVQALIQVIKQALNNIYIFTLAVMQTKSFYFYVVSRAYTISSYFFFFFQIERKKFMVLSNKFYVIYIIALLQHLIICLSDFYYQIMIINIWHFLFPKRKRKAKIKRFWKRSQVTNTPKIL